MADEFSLLDIHFELPAWELVVKVTPWAWGAAVVIVAGLIAWRLLHEKVGAFGQLELESADFGLDGKAAFKFKPNWTDRQVAYAIWVELSTRKIGLPITLENDVISEIYDSWYAFFGVARELIKTVPVSRASDKSTREIIRLSMAVLNDGLRPHLTRWQARFRRWYEVAAADPANAGRDPQEIQAMYPQWKALTDDLAERNKGMIAYGMALQAIYGGEAMTSATLREASPAPIAGSTSTKG
jgi:hypothetical protein